MNVQIFGSNKSQDSKKALRFFKERGIKPHFVDLKQREIAPGELKRFVQQSGLDALIDTNSKSYKSEGLEHFRITDEQWLDKLIEDYTLMTQPLVRSGKHLSVGWDENYWKDVIKNA